MDTDKTFPYAIVIGMDTPTGLQTARILHRNGIPVIGFAKNPGHYCCKTNSCEKIIRCNTDSAELIESLVELGPTLGRDAVVFACSDISVIHLSRNKERLTDWYRVPIPEAEVVEKLIDKESFYRYADA